MHKIRRAVVLGCVGVLACAGRAVAFPTAAEEAAALPGKVADAAGEDAGKRSLATEWLMNTVPATLPLIEKAAADAKGTPAAARLEAVVSVLKPLDAIRVAEKADLDAFNEWNIRTALAAYDAAGPHDPHWVAKARRAIEEAVSIDPAQKAKALGMLEHVTRDLQCDDPLVAYFDARLLEEHFVPNDQKAFTKMLQAYMFAVNGIHASMYPADRKIMAVGRACSIFTKYQFVKQHAEAAPMLDQMSRDMLKWWPEMLAEKGLPFQTAYAAGRLVLDARVGAGADRKTVLDQMLPALEKTFPNDPGVEVFKGNAMVEWAWDARGSGYANTVSAAGWIMFHDRLARAAAVLEKAWAAHPTDPGAPMLMMTIGMGESWPAAKLDLWFHRAMTAHPDMTTTRYEGLGTPFDDRVTPMMPKWGGSHEEMLAFGHHLLAGRNWRGLVPFQLAVIHEYIAADSAWPGAYWKQPEVWADMDKMTAGPLRIWPDDVTLQSTRAFYAWRCGQWKVADDMFKKLGDRCLPTLFGGPDGLGGARASAAAGAAKEAAEPKAE